ncbi:acyl-CoA synthetase [Nocardia huaxiensis]|uniref:Acyl-CoA synthetase n=1 Tax=Nocardia huaxiensis TaxID=2755382 RepID=A0A7D6Z4W0_9NOCA|nr:acyl-CoA synthetase [Nocardia huaxiensis]QLY31344.1 acyl-CoA synthetase [Nocardia huaxiensis]UFS94886.1 acyl-CoA synthetase [Nocardia huaxiensis]
MARNFADLYEHAADAMPDRTALIAGDRRLTFRELDQRANRLAHHLAAAGAGVGTHIGFHMHNSAETLETLIACFKIRAVPVNINYRYQAEELRYVYDNADLEMLVHHRCYAPLIEEVRAQVPKLRHALVVEDDQGDGLASGSTPYEQAVESGSPARDFGERSADDLFMMYTGGTTGLPKGVMWRQEDMWRVLGGGIDFYTGEPVADEYQQSRTGSQAQPTMWFVLPPLIHAAAMMPTFTALWSGNAVLFTPRFDPVRIWETVARERPNILVITGDAMARPLIDAYRAAPVDAGSVWSIGSGAALLSQPVKNQLLELFPSTVLTDSIGSSETGFGGIGFAQKDDDPGRGPRVNVGRGALVVDDDGRSVPPGSEGWVAKTGNVPIGYYKDPEKTAKLFRTVDGVRMVITDDRARVEADGSVTLIGRGNMVVNTGGEKVFPEEVEAVVKAHDSVYDAVVIGVPHERWGQQVAAVISAAHPALDFAALEQHVRAHLAGYKLPRSIWVADAVSRTPSGKPDYRWAKTYVSDREPDHVVR